MDKYGLLELENDLYYKLQEIIDSYVDDPDINEKLYEELRELCDQFEDLGYDLSTEENDVGDYDEGYADGFNDGLKERD